MFYSHLNLILNTRTCPTTVVPLHVATAKDHGDFVCHSDKQVFLLLHLTTPCKCGNQFNCG